MHRLHQGEASRIEVRQVALSHQGEASCRAVVASRSKSHQGEASRIEVQQVATGRTLPRLPRRLRRCTLSRGARGVPVAGASVLVCRVLSISRTNLACFVYQGCFGEAVAGCDACVGCGLLHCSRHVVFSAVSALSKAFYSRFQVLNLFCRNRFFGDIRGPHHDVRFRRPLAAASCGMLRQAAAGCSKLRRYLNFITACRVYYGACRAANDGSRQVGACRA